MAEVAKGIIDIEINTGSAASQLQALQSQINAFNLALNKGNKAQGTFAAEYSKELQSAINKTGLFTAETVRLSTAASTLDKNLSKGKTSLGQFFSAKFNKNSAMAAETMALAAERAKRLQTQFIATSGATNGFQEALAVRPLAAFSSEAAIAAQRTQLLSNMFKQGTTQLINFGKNVQWAGRQLMVGFTIPLTIFGSIAGKTFMDLEKQVVGFKKVYGDLFTTPADLEKNLEAVKGLASEYTKYGIAVKDTIGLAAEAAAAGRQGVELTDATTQATRLSVLGQMDQNQALETTISLQSAFKLSGQDLADTINFLNMVENQTVVTLQDIANAIPRVAPVIAGLGGDVKDLTVFLAAMQEGGVNANEGANALKSGLASLINPTKQATAMLSGFGINLDAIIQANKGDLMGTVQSFAQALATLDQFSRQQALEQVFGKFQYAKLGALFDNITREGSQAQQVIETMAYSTEQLASTADKELKTIEESFGVQLTGAVERFKLSIAPIGELFVRLAIPLVNFATKIAESFNSLSDGQKRFAAIAAVIVGVVIPAVTMMTGLFLNLVGTLAKVGQGIALFGKGFITGGPIGAIKALTQSSKYLSLAEIDAAMAAQQLSGATAILNKTLVDQAIQGNAAAAAIGNLTRAYGAMAATQGAAGALPSFGVAAAAGRNAKNSQMSIRTLRRNAGGGVPGVGNTDTVPAMLTPGEFVINKEATKQNLGLLKAINDGNIQGLNKGGIANGVQYLNRGAVVSQARNILNIVGKRNGAIGTIDDFLKSPSVSDDVKKLLIRFGSISRAGNVSRNPLSQLSNSAELSKIRLNADEMMKLNPLFKGKGSRYQVKGTAGVYVGDITDPSILKKYPDLVSKGKISRERLNGLLTEGKLPSDLMRAGAMASGAVHSTSTRQFLNALESSGQISKGEAKRISDIVESTYFSTIEKNPMLGDKTNPLWKISDDVIKKELSTNKNAKEFWNNFSREIGANTNETRMAAGLSKRSGGSTSAGRIVLTNKDGVSVIVGRLSGSRKENSLFAHTTTPTPFIDRVGQIVQNKNKGGAIKKYANGGPVPGSGNSDTVPAMLTPGEFVVNKKATSQNQQLLEMMNGGKVKGYNEGGMVQNVSGEEVLTKKQRVSSRVKSIGRGVGLSSMIGFGIGQELGGTAGGFAGSIAMPMIAKAAGPLIAKIGISTAAFAGVAAPLALAGFAIYKLNESLEEARKSGAELSEAMYGSAKTTNAMADAFGRETNAAALRRKAVEKAGGQEITQESVAASSEFMKTDAAAEIIKDLELVKKSGEDVALALRNQLASSIVAGAITPEEAKAISIDIGKALNDENLSVEVSGQLSSLLGPNGEKIVNNIVEITAEISPKINSQQIKNDAEEAYNNLNIAQKFGEIFTGGRESFIEQFSIDKISEENASALTKEAEARALLNISYQEGTISLKEYLDAESQLNSGAKDRSSFVENANAQALGFDSTAAMQSKLQEHLGNLNVDTTGMSTLAASQAQSLGQARAKEDSQGKAAYEAIVTKSKDALKQAFIEDEMDATMAESIVSEIESGIALVDPEIFDKLISGQVSLDQLPMLERMIDQGIPQEKIDSLFSNLKILESIPNIDLVVDINNPDPDEIQSLVDEYLKFESLSDIEKKAYVETNVSAEDLDRFKTSYEEIMKLPDNEIVNVTKMIEVEIKFRSEMSVAAKSGDMEQKRLLQAEADKADKYVKSVLESLDSLVNEGDQGNQGVSGTGGTKEAKQTLQEYLAEFKKLTKEKEKYLAVTIKYLGTTKMEAVALIDQGRLLEANAMIESKSSKIRKEGKKILADLIKLAEERLSVERATAFLSMSAGERELQRLGLQEKALDKKANKEQEIIRNKQKEIDINNKALDEISEKEEIVNKAYDDRLKALDKVSQANNRIAQQESSRISLASALASGDIAAAATISSEIQQQEAQYRIEDARAALEDQRQKDLESITVRVNGQLLTREQIEGRNKNLSEEIETVETRLSKIEETRLGLAKDRARQEEKILLLQQQQLITDLKKLEAANKLTDPQKKLLETLIKDFNTGAKSYNEDSPGTKGDFTLQKNYGGVISKMAFGGIAYKGSTESPPALRMNYGSTVPGVGMIDKVPALLTPGEFVVRKPVAKQYGGFLEKLNGQVFPEIGGNTAVPTNNFLEGIGSPRYSIPQSSVSDIPVSNLTNVSNSSPMYNSTYNVNVNVAGTNASPDDIANVVMAKISSQNRGNLRSSKY